MEKPKLKIRFAMWLADILPDRVAYFLIIKVLAKATTGENSNVEPHTVTAFRLLDLVQENYDSRK